MKTMTADELIDIVVEEIRTIARRNPGLLFQQVPLDPSTVDADGNVKLTRSPHSQYCMEINLVPAEEGSK